MKNNIYNNIKRKASEDYQMGGFTLVELIVAVSILSIGLVLIVRSLLTVSGALDSGINDLYAVRVLEEKLSGLKEQLLTDPEEGISPQAEDIVLGARKADFELDIDVLEGDYLVEGEELQTTIDEVKMSVSWKENNRGKQLVLGTYFLEEE